LPARVVRCHGRLCDGDVEAKNTDGGLAASPPSLVDRVGVRGFEPPTF
jgi:hypothetical protein